MKSLVFGLLGAFFVTGCSFMSQDRVAKLPVGMWRGTLSFQTAELPFNFRLQKDSSGAYAITIINDKEQLLLDEVNIKGDSVSIPLHIFDASFRVIARNDSLIGIFIKHYDPSNTVPFTAVFGQDYRFKKPHDNKVTKDFTGKFRVVFTNEKDTTLAIGVFKQKADSVTGTFLTTSGDYRYLQGNVINDTMKLSGFDGNHAYLFSSVFSSRDELRGMFFSSRVKKSVWKGWRDENASLPNPDSLTVLNKGYEKIEFAFPDVNGNKISLSDEKFKNKVVILQFLGTWCPNCMDETRFLIPWYEKNKMRGIEIIGLAFERKDDFSYASDRVKRMDQKMNIPYDLVIAGTNDKALASTKFPMLSEISSFPTTIFIGKDGKVKRIHTGFSGPGTGKYYEEYIKDFNQTVDKLVNEKQNENATIQ